MIEGVVEIKKEVKEYFEDRFKRKEVPRPRFKGIDFPKLTELDSAALDEEFSREEIKEVVFSCEGDRSPGLDNFNLEFIKRCWDIMGKDIVQCVQDYHAKASF